MASGRIPSLTETCRFLSDPKLDGRSPGSPGHRVAQDYLRDMLDRLGFDPLFGDTWSQPVPEEGGETIGVNLGGIKQGRSGRSILLAAHYDHFKGIPGADDNAAALSILVETSRLIGTWRGETNLVLCFFDLEEPPYFQGAAMGSMFFVEHPPIDLNQLTCAIVLDLCGHDVAIPGREDALFVLGAEYSPDLVQALNSVEGRSIPTYMFRNDRVGDLSDHHAFRIHGLPFLFFSCGRWEHYHQPSDTFDRLNLDKMQRIAEHLVALVRELDGVRVKIAPVEEFWRQEARSLERLVGFPASSAQREVDTIISTLIQQFAQ